MSETAVQTTTSDIPPSPLNTAVSQADQTSAVTNNDQSSPQSDDTIEKINAIKASLESQINQPESSTPEQPVNPQTNQVVLDLLNQLDSFTSSINQSILAATQIGITVNKINKSKPPQSSEIKDKAKSLVSSWKTIVAPKSTTPIAATRTTSKPDTAASRTPSPPSASPAISASPAKSASPVKAPLSAKQPSAPASAKQPSATSSNTAPASAKRKAPAAVDVKTTEKAVTATKRAKTDAAPQPTTPASKPTSVKTPISSSSSSPANKDSSSSGEFRLGRTGNETRNKIQKLLFEAIGGDSGDWEVELACRIESAMWSQYKDTNAAYKSKYRELAMNLKDPANPDLNDALLAGAWTPEQIVSMSSKDLASQSLKDQREKDAKWEMAAARSDLGKLNGLTDMFRCGKCRERKCTYYQMQTRSADEPMTVFVRCTVCGNRWKC